VGVSTSPYHESVVKSREFELLASCVLDHAVKDDGHCRGVVVGNACIGVMSARPAWNNRDNKPREKLHTQIVILRAAARAAPYNLILTAILGQGGAAHRLQFQLRHEHDEAGEWGRQLSYPLTLRMVGLASVHELKSLTQIVSRSPQITYSPSTPAGFIFRLYSSVIRCTCKVVQACFFCKLQAIALHCIAWADWLFTAGMQPDAAVMYRENINTSAGVYLCAKVCTYYTLDPSILWQLCCL